MDKFAEPIPIYRVRSDGTTDRLGFYRHVDKVLQLERAGFPLLGPGEHHVEGDLPWVFWDMCPSGFLGRLFHRSLPELGLPPNPQRWSPQHALIALSRAGDDLAGNLLLGDACAARRLRSVGDRKLGRLVNFDGDVGEFLRATTGAADSSSLGGDQPKILSYSNEGQGTIIKSSPPLNRSAAGQRWGDLLRMEHHCAVALRNAGLSASITSLTEGIKQSNRQGLAVLRFDRVRNFGRRGSTTLYWLAADLYGDASMPAPEVIARLVDEGHLPPESTAVVSKVHAFSDAIGNNDSHLGNYGLLFDDDGRAQLAPFYDILPMALAPKADELPDRFVKKRPPPRDAEVRALVEALVARVEADAEISPEFKKLWLSIIDL